MGEVGVEFLALQPAQVVLDDEPLLHRFVHGHGEAPSQFGQPHQHQAQPGGGVHVEVGQQPEVFQHVVAQMVGLVDDEHRLLFGLADQAVDLGLDGAIRGGAGAFGGQGPAADRLQRARQPRR